MTTLRLLHQEIHRHSIETPDRTAFRFVLDPRDLANPSSWAKISYAELEEGACAVAVMLRSRFPPGIRVLLVHPPGPDFVKAFIGCLYANAVAVPTILPNSAPARQRLLGIIDDADPTALLTTEPFVAVCADVVLQSSRELPCIETDGLSSAGRSEVIACDPEDLAFLQYTSGSTRSPRGVRITHRNLIENIAMIERHLMLDASDKQVSWVPPYHDMGLIVGILQPLHLGAEAILMSPLAFLADPLCWLETLTHVGGTFSGAPNFAFDLCTRNATDERVAKLDLRSWSVAFSGAEPIRASTLDAFAKRFASAGFDARAFLPAYGLAEATLAVSSPAPMRGALTGAPRRVFRKGGMSPGKVVGVGQPMPPTVVRIVDPETLEPCHEGAVGEIWVQAPGVSSGYWECEERKDASFLEAIPGEPSCGEFLRTGDLGFTDDGELFVCGRLKDLVILRGQNHYPQDIEETAWSQGALLRPGCTAAFAVDVGDREALVIVQECSREPTATETSDIAIAVGRAVQREHGIPVDRFVLIEKKTIPKTSAGKIRRRATREAFEAGQLKALYDSGPATAGG